MTIAERITRAGGDMTIAGAPEGLDAWLIADMARQSGGPVLHVARDDQRLAAVRDALAFFAPDLRVLTFPAWDCLPYDRVSPSAEITAARMETLFDLTHPEEASRAFVVLTTANALIQRVPEPDLVAQSGFAAQKGETIDTDSLARFLAINGYSRVSTVMEPGDFAMRGDIVDIFPPGAERPLRLDLFGDTLETVREFDPLSQRTTGKRDSVRLIPASEILLNEDSIDRFRAGYLALFGGDTRDDPLYQAVSEGRRYQGMEHWLPLFHETLTPLTVYLPGAIVTFDHLAEEALGERHKQVDDYYQARSGETAAAWGDSVPYKPVPPDRLYLDETELENLLAERPVRRFSPFKQPDGEKGIDAGGRRARDFAPERAQSDINLFDALADHLRDLTKDGKQVIIAAYSDGARERLRTVLADHNMSDFAPVADWPAAGELPRGKGGLAVLRLEHGFETGDLAVISEQDILGDRLVRRPKRSRRAEDFISAATALSKGDIVVHLDHGVGRFTGLRTIDVAGHAHDCVTLEYAGGDKLLLPVENIDVLSRYGGSEAEVQLDRLGSHNWQARKAQLKKRLMDMADSLIKLAAERELQSAPKITVPPGLYEEFCARFPYQETGDQLRAIEDVMTDLAAGTPMDRLVCGDVGFGKTEVALRAAFVTALSGYQIAVVAPTTLLARQHYETFRERFQGLPVRIRALSRLVTGTEAKKVKDGLASGEVDIVIGTHALLHKTVSFKQLGLVVVDEEQHFGVKHKERLKDLRSTVHVLTLTATPIPRTLQLAMSGLRGLSLIATPPVDRLAIRTYVMPFDTLIVREAILREYFRGGQSFFVAPRIADLGFIERFLREEVPEVKYAVAHGRMPARQLEDVMNAYYEGAYDVLICTSIIESGLDIPNANTMIVHRSDMFGLAQLYQMRGRIGRSKMRAYAYMTVPAGRVLTENAQKRLDVLQALDTLGAGFSLASHDLDIRGAGNLLGEEQSGHIREVGLELYQHMLEEAVAQARTREGKTVELGEEFAPQISLGTAVLIPEDYIGDLDIRMSMYRRIARIEDREELDSLAAEMIDRFGPLPDAVENLLETIAIREFCREAHVEKIEAGPKGAVIAFRDDHFPNVAGLVDFLSKQPGFAKLRPDHRLVIKQDWPAPSDRLKGTKRILERLAALAKETPETANADR